MFCIFCGVTTSMTSNDLTLTGSFWSACVLATDLERVISMTRESEGVING